MTTELSLKELKALVDENDLDLSMRQLTSIPVKALNKLPRATHLDFSNNLLANVPSEFCQLTHITKLDLSNNRIVQLPEQFGKLINLAHLDLYKNEIQTLPLSFGDLPSLKWLDLKGNPLEAELAKVAGDCLDEKSCKQAAINVVRYMHDRATKQQRVRDKQKPAVKQNEGNDEKNHNTTNVQKEKAKKKKNKQRNSFNEQPEIITERIQQEGQQMNAEKKQQKNHAKKKNGKRNSKSSAMSFLWKSIIVLFFFSLLLSGFAVFMLVSNCFNDSRYINSSSKPFCKDVRTVLSDHSLPSTFAGNFFFAFASMLKTNLEAFEVFFNDLQRNNFANVMEGNFHAFCMKMKSIALLIQGYVLHKYEDFVALYNAIAADTVNDVIQNIWLLIRIFCLMLGDLLLFIADKGMLFISSSIETIFTYAHRGDQLAEMLRKWWNSVK